MLQERLPPHDIGAEESVLGAILADDHAMPLLAALVQPGEFFREKHAIVFRAALALFARGEPCSPIFVAHELSRSNQLDAIGGTAYLSKLTDDLPTSIGADFYARIVARDAGYRRLISAAGIIAQEAYEGGPDLEICASNAIHRIVTAAGSNAARTEWTSVGELVAANREALLAELLNPQIHPGISTGLRALDRVLDGGGLVPGLLYVSGGQTSMGKTLFLSTVLRNIALAGHEVALLTLETQPEILMRQLVYGLAGIDRSWYQSTGAEPDDRDVAAFTATLDRAEHDLAGLHVLDARGCTIDQIRLHVARAMAQWPLRVVGVDYLHKVKPLKRTSGFTRADELSDMVREFGDLAGLHNVALLLMAQTNRQNLDRKTRKGEDFKPNMGDFLGCGDIERFANCIMALHRHDWYADRGMLEPRPQLRGILEVLCLKQQTGIGGTTVRLRFDGAHSTIEDWE